MTNAEIIFKNRLFLMEQGVIKATEEIMTITDDNGDRKEVNVPEEIHTFQAWKKMGYIVNRGEHAIAKFPIWKFKPNGKKGEEEAEEDKEASGKMFMKIAFFFTANQVSKIGG